MYTAAMPTDDLLKMDQATRRRRLEAELERFLKILAELQGLERVILFGSLAGGETQLWSDIDLAIIQRTDLPFLARLRAVRRLLRPQVAADFLIYTPTEFEQLARERPFVREEIVAKGKVIYERTG
jgi:predicted nucleotidyltransferase